MPNECRIRATILSRSANITDIICMKSCGHPATESQATACRTLSWERRGKSDRSDPDRSQCPAGGRPLQDTSQGYDPLLLCPANTKAERHLRKSCDFPRQLPHGKQAFVPTTRRGTCLPNRRNRPYSLGTHCRYVHHRKKQMDAT